MKRLGIALAFACNCAHTPPVVHGVINCAVQATRDTAVNILPAVATAIAAGTWEDQLAALLVQWGEDALDCAVHQLTVEAQHDMAMSPSDKLASQRAQRGAAWLQKRGVSFQ